MPNSNSVDAEVTDEVILDTQSGVLSDVDIKEYIDKNEIVIYPYDDYNLTGLGYNLSFTKFIYSINKKTLCNIQSEGNNLFCYAEPNDTLLIISHEAVWISKSLSGTFYSKVGIVSKGFGHISTTLDPEWEGPLLFSLNNPTNQRIKFLIGNKTEDGIKYETFVTLILHKMISKANKTHDNEPGRIYDILKHIKNDLKTRNNAGQLINVFDKIDLLQIRRLQIGVSATSEEKQSKITKFENKYKKMDDVIDNCICETNKIKEQERQKKQWTIFVFAILILFINYFVFKYANQFLYKILNGDILVITPSILSILAILVSIDIPIIAYLINKIRR